MTNGVKGNALTALSEAITAAVERAGASTIQVNARRRIPASGVVWSDDGVIVTASHVVEREDEIKVGLPDGSRADASFVGRDPGTDLAVLRVEGQKLEAATLADSPAVVGNLVLAVGRPLGPALAASFGVVSLVGGPWRSMGGTQVEGYIRSELTFYPGFSGGPLVDGEGRLLGINSSYLDRSDSITIPAASVGRIVEALLKGGTVKRGYLGIGNQPVRLPAALAEKAGGQETGLLIMSVEPGTPADRGGMIVGDILVGMAGSPVRDTDDLQSLLGPERVGQATTLVILRGGERREITVTVGERG
ncbi:MAG: PDZ domain-containing protein [Dehalococcoidia bacterium]|nr:PDZ domain-containing protein [Dehalococcoidia bacterium]